MDVGPKHRQPESDVSCRQDGELMAALISCRSSRWHRRPVALRSTDQVAGFTSSMKKGIRRGVMATQLTDIFERSRDSFQQRRSVSRSQ